MKFCAEIQYEGEYFDVVTQQMEKGGIHSDICHACGDPGEGPPLDDEYRKFLHDCLDEWLDNSNGTGHFVVGNWWEDYTEECNELRKEIWALRKQLKNT